MSEPLWGWTYSPRLKRYEWRNECDNVVVLFAVSRNDSRDDMATQVAALLDDYTAMTGGDTEAATQLLGVGIAAMVQRQELRNA